MHLSKRTIDALPYFGFLGPLDFELLDELAHDVIRANTSQNVHAKGSNRLYLEFIISQIFLIKGEMLFYSP